MDDLFKKITFRIKSSKRSSSSSSRSITPSPHPTTLPPPLPTPDIPIQLPVGPLLPPPIITAGNATDVPIPPTPLTQPLIQAVVSRRDQAAKVFEHSPLSKQLSLPNVASQYQQQQEQAEMQRGRYRFRNESATFPKLSPRSSSLSSKWKVDEKSGKQKKKPFIPSPPPNIPSAAARVVVKEPRFRPATTFEEILGVNGASRVDYSFPLPPDDFAFCASGSSAIGFGTSSIMCRIREDPKTRIRTYPNLNALASVVDGGSVTTNAQPLIFCQTDPPTPLISAAENPALADYENQVEIEANLSNPHSRCELITGDGSWSIQEENGKGYGSKCVDGEPGVEPYKTSGSPLALGFSSILDHEPYRNTPRQNPHILQVDANNVSEPQRQNNPSASSELFGRPDPFGFRSTVPTQAAVKIANKSCKVSCPRRCKEFFASNARNIRTRALCVLTARPGVENTADADMHPEQPGESEEDMGTRKAIAVVRSWNRADLVTCYVFLVILTTYFSLGSVHSILIIKEGLNDWAIKGEIKVYQLELAISMLGVTRILGMMTFAKLTNTYSRPCALFVAVIFAIGGIGISAFAVTWESFCAGHAIFYFGGSGTLVVAQVIIADMSDLSWRGLLTWGLEFGLVFWTWTIPIIEKLVTGKLGWHVPIWIFFSFAFPAAIPPVVATYVFHRRASNWGFFPATKNVHRHAWWSIGGLSNRLTMFSTEYDLLGVLLWTIGVGLLATALSLSEEMQAGIGVWMAALLVGGSLSVITLVTWEVWLNNGLMRMKLLIKHQSFNHKYSARPIDCNNNTGNSGGRALNGRATISGPAGYDSASVAQMTAQISARIAASQDPGNLTRWRRFGSCRERCHPLFRTRLLKRRTIPLGCLIGFLASFAMKAGAWVAWKRPEDLPLNYRQLVESVQGKEILANIDFTSMIVAGLFVSFMIRITKLFKRFVVSGLLLMMAGLLTFYSADICMIGQRQLVFSQVLTGLGAGMVWIGLMVGVQASCKRHSDVAISIGLFSTFNALGNMTAEAMKRLMQAYLLRLLPPSSSQEDFARAFNGHWSVMLIAAIAATTFALVMAGVGLSGHNLDGVKQHVSGVVFGTDDIERRKDDEEHPSWATPEPFIQSPQGVNVESSGHIAPLMNAIEENARAARENGLSGERQFRSTSCTASGGLEAVGYAQSGAQGSPAGDIVTKNPKNPRIHESAADWETSASESTISRLRTSDSGTITSHFQIPSGSIDGIFTMDIDMEKTPRAAASSISGPFGNASKNSATSPPVDTLTVSDEGTIRQDYSQFRLAKGPNKAAEGNMGDSQCFSFKKRKIKVFSGEQKNSTKSKADYRGEHSIWSDPSSESEIVRTNSLSSSFGEDLATIADPIQVAPSPTGGLKQDIPDWYIAGEERGSRQQLISGVEIPPRSNGASNPESRQLSPEVSLIDSALASNEAEVPGLQRNQSSETDGRVSRFLYQDDDISERIRSSENLCTYKYIATNRRQNLI